MPYPVKALTHFEKSATGTGQSMEDLEFDIRVIYICKYLGLLLNQGSKTSRDTLIFNRILFSPLHVSKNVPGFSLFPFFKLSDAISSLAAPYLPLPFSDNET